jgi:hypothetical protein
VSEISFLKLRFNTALAIWSLITSDKLCGILISADETGARGSRYELPGPGSPDRGPSPDYFACVFVFLDSIIICRVHKLTLSDHAQVCLQLTVGAGHLFLNQYKSRIKIFSRYALAGGPKKYFSSGPEPALCGSDFNRCIALSNSWQENYCYCNSFLSRACGSWFSAT